MSDMASLIGGMGKNSDMDMSMLMSMMEHMGGVDGMGAMGGVGGMGVGGATGMSGVGGMGGLGGMSSESDADRDAERESLDGKSCWMQNGDEIQIRCALNSPAAKQDIQVKFKPAGLTAVVRGERVIDGNLAGRIEIDDCTWSLSADRTELQIMLTKKNDASWHQLLACVVL